MTVYSSKRYFLFLLAGARRDGNAELLARHAAFEMSADVRQHWLRLMDLPLPAFDDVRHLGDGIYPAPKGNAKMLLEFTLAATDIVFVAPLYWYGLPAAAKLYLDHWSGWMRISGADFKERMAEKTMWAISSYSGTDPATASPLFATLRLTAEYLHMDWGGSVLGYGNRPWDILEDASALQGASRLFRPLPLEHAVPVTNRSLAETRGIS